MKNKLLVFVPTLLDLLPIDVFTGVLICWISSSNWTTWQIVSLNVGNLGLIFLIRIYLEKDFYSVFLFGVTSGKEKQTWEKEQFKKANPELLEMQPKVPLKSPNEKKWMYIDVEDTILNITQQRCIFASFRIVLRLQCNFSKTSGGIWRLDFWSRRRRTEKGLETMLCLPDIWKNSIQMRPTSSIPRLCTLCLRCVAKNLKLYGKVIY